MQGADGAPFGAQRAAEGGADEAGGAGDKNSVQWPVVGGQLLASRGCLVVRRRDRTLQASVEAPANAILKHPQGRIAQDDRRRYAGGRPKQ